MKRSRETELDNILPDSCFEPSDSASPLIPKQANTLPDSCFEPSDSVSPLIPKQAIYKHGGSGQLAMCEAISRVFGFPFVDVELGAQVLRDGGRLITNGYWDCKQFRDIESGQCYALWHSAIGTSELLGELESLEQVRNRSSQANGPVILWLNEYDAPLPWAERILPVWSPGQLRELCAVTVDRNPNAIAVTMGGKWTRPVKNTIASLAACRNLGATLHVSKAALGSEIAKALVKDEQVVQHPDDMSRQDMIRTLRSVALLVFMSHAESWPTLPMEAVYSGTPVVLTDATPWSAHLAPWAQDLCIVRPSIASGRARELIAFLLSSDRERTRLLIEQRRCLNELAPVYAARAAGTWRRLGFDVGEPCLI